MEISLEEFIVFHNSNKHSITKFVPLDIRDIEDLDIINDVITNIIKALSRKIYKKDNITNGCYVLIYTKIEKKDKIFKDNNIKGKHQDRIPGIFQNFINNNTANIISSIDYKEKFKKVACDISILNWVDEIVYNYMLKKISNNDFID